MTFVIPEPARVALPVVDSLQTFPVRRVWCVGRNYAAHAREMGADPNREAPFFFSKPGDAIVPPGGEVPYPSATSDLHHEVELVVAIGLGGVNVTADLAEDMIWGYAVGVDLTRRDLQAEAKKAGRPWDTAKGFDASGPMGPLVPKKDFTVSPDTAIVLGVDGQDRQAGTLGELIWSVPEVIAQLSTLVALAPGDLIFTGTPSGVGPVTQGQAVRAEVAGLPPLVFTLT